MLNIPTNRLTFFLGFIKTLKSEIYSFPKIAGDYVLTPKTIIDCNALITAADYHHEKDFIALTGYNTKGNQFFFLIRDFVKNGFDKINLERYLIPIELSLIHI